MMDLQKPIPGRERVMNTMDKMFNDIFPLSSLSALQPSLERQQTNRIPLPRERCYQKIVKIFSLPVDISATSKI